ncbi:MAG: hypothetical protein KME26_17390 [Oscillatoria princeps RMCB-10]|nr:hypothetical protein [Oscillatoria princeps RMCB-10]
MLSRWLDWVNFIITYIAVICLPVGWLWPKCQGFGQRLVGRLTQDS